ncbi:MAG: NHL repeat-containing protein, partial [Candidatus Diapherotrites archaeon]|nr:NHL repeat-containing protein [Candidatus Diapherotrites archaeon]
YFMPRYVAVALVDGTVFASEEVNQRVVVLNSDFSFRDVIGESLGPGNTQFFSPLNMAADKQGNLYVADKDNHRVQVFDSSLQFVKTIGTGRGNGNTEFDGPRSIAIDSTGRIFVVDKGNARVQVFSPSGDYVATIKSGTGYALVKPEPIAIDASDNIYVASASEPTITVFDKQLNYVKTIDAGDDMGELEGGMVIDGKGRIVVVGISSGQIRMIDAATGAAVKTVGGFGTANGKFNWPGGIAIMPNGNFVVADVGSFRLQVLDSELNFVKIVNGGTDFEIETAQ